MSSQSVAEVRADFRTAEDELTRASHLLSTVTEFAEARKHGGDADPTPVERAASRFLSPGPGPAQTAQTRRSELAYLTKPLLDHDGTARDFFAVARAYESAANRTGSGEESVTRFIDHLEQFVTGTTDHVPPAETLATLANADDRAMAGHLRAVISTLVTAARAWRDEAQDRLNDQYTETDDGDYKRQSTGTIQSFLDAHDDTVETLSDEPIALLPVRLETRFVDGDLLVRVYPDRIHEDSHEPQLSDTERQWGQNFWAYAWYATVEFPTATEFATDLPAERHDELVTMLAELPDEGYPTDPAERKQAIRTRAWGQLVERFGRERASFVVHALKPEVGGESDDADWSYLLDETATAQSVGALSFPEPDGRPGSWTRAPVARLLPDEWLIYGVWATEGESDNRETFLVRGGAIREPLRIGPDPGAMAVAMQAVDETPESTRTEEGIDWLVDFDAAERAGMALRITSEDVFDAGSKPLDSGYFEKLVVTGVKASMDADRTARELRDLFDAQHYTNGLAMVPQGTPTNNADENAGYRSRTDPEETVDVEAAPPLVEHGDVTDGDLLARALAIDPSSLGDDDHVFAHVADADATDQLDAWHANSALWSGTIGYYLQTMLRPNRYDGTSETPPLFDQLDTDGQPDISDWLDGDDPASWYEAYRRHFIEYVRPGGPLPTFRAGRQPYGVLPAAISDPDSDDRLWAGADLSDVLAPDSKDRTSPGGNVKIPRRKGGKGTRDWSLEDIGLGGSNDEESTEETDKSSLKGDDPARDFAAGSTDEFRKTYRPEDAKGSIPDADLAKTYTPEETATVFSSKEIATHYSPDDASTVLSTDELNANYSSEELASSSVKTDAKGRAIDEESVDSVGAKTEDDRDDAADEKGGWFR
ncbi:hypothetical protein [Haloarchaeobius sp. HME9146]|uniref:hypothetical protein n=1 Tax=Haloarchaeobius sp. HME9146 TaxID=2978732 RepID=UPI0021BEBD47|nr:hypothetical protein [Haloarchaeobius sp. HME9146]MCT9098244.1 hypothetical protein [Haloarchaeobius sp. HME9146]